MAGARRPDRVGVFGDGLVERCPHAAHDLRVDSVEYGFTVGEVAVQRAAGDLGLAVDVGHRQPAGAAAGQCPHGTFDDHV